MNKVMISQPMNGLSDKEIIETRNKAVGYLKDSGYDVVNSLFVEVPSVPNIPLYYLAKSLEKMASCDAVYFCKGYSSARGCKIEHDAAVSYGLETIYEQEE